VTAPTCGQFREFAPELALEVLPGAERAAAIAHLERCAACRDHLSRLATVGDGLLGLVPGHEPSSGFETRVLRRLHPDPPVRRRRGLLVAAALVIAAGAGLVGSVVGTDIHPTVSAVAQPLRTGTFTIHGHEAGQIFLYAGSPAWVYMAVDTDHPNDTISCQLRGADGNLVTIGEFPVWHGQGYWGAPLTIEPGTVTEARLVASDGTVLATSRLSA
jgi:hypothetical protein